MNKEEIHDKITLEYYNDRNQQIGMYSANKLKDEQEDEEDKQVDKLDNFDQSKTSINYEFEIPPRSTTAMKKQQQYEFRYSVPPMNKQPFSVRFLLFIRKPFTKIFLLLSILLILSLIVIEKIWGIKQFYVFMEKVLYILCLEFLWKSFYLMFFYWIKLFEQKNRLIVILIQIIQHYLLTITLMLTYGNQICLDKVNDHLFCAIKTDLILDLLNYLSAAILYLIIIWKTPENLQISKFVKLNALEHIICMILILLLPQSVVFYIILGLSFLTKALLICVK